MKIFICASKYCYDKIPPIQKELERNGHKITLPNSYEDPFQEERIKKENPMEHLKLKEKFFIEQINNCSERDKTGLCEKELEQMVNYAMDDLKTGKVLAHNIQAGQDADAVLGM